MNALARKIMNVAESSAAARSLGGVAAAALVSGCVATHVASVKVDPNSSVAPEVARMAKATRTYPRFSDIPPQPTEVRPARVYGERARKVEQAREELDAATAPSTWTLGNTQGFASRAHSDAGPDYAAPAASDTEAFANTARKRATPPPPTTP